MLKEITLEVNQQKKTLTLDPEIPLLYVLRQHFEINSSKFGCGMHQCGSCMVLVDQEVEPSCLSPCGSFTGKKITTLEGLHEDTKLRPVQEAFIQTQAAQCGYCLNGVILSTVALLKRNPKPTDIEIKEALNPVICRCGTHSRFIAAVKLAAGLNETDYEK